MENKLIKFVIYKTIRAESYFDIEDKINDAAQMGWEFIQLIIDKTPDGLSDYIIILGGR